MKWVFTGSNTLQILHTNADWPSLYEHITQMLQDLHWMWPPERIDLGLAVLIYWCLHGLAPRYLSDYIQHVADSNHRCLRSSSSSQSVIRLHDCPLLAIVRFWWLEAASGTVCRSTSPQLRHWLFVGTTSELISFLNHFLPNCFRFLILYTVYSSGLAVLYLSHSK